MSLFEAITQSDKFVPALVELISGLTGSIIAYNDPSQFTSYWTNIGLFIFRNINLNLISMINH